MLKELQELGLSSKEAKVYVACFEVGEGSAQRIALGCKLPKSTVADTLRELNKKGLVSIAVKKSRRIFSASDLSAFQEKMKRQKEAFEKVYPELYALFNSHKQKPRVRFYEGKEGMAALTSEILQEAKEMIGFGSPDEAFKKMEEYFPEFPKRRAEKGIPIKLIFRDTPFARERQRLGPSQLREVKLVSEVLPFNSLVWVWNHKIAMIGMDRDFMVLIIENIDFASMLKSFFTLLWNKVD